MNARAFLQHYLPNISDEIVDHGIDTQKFKPAPAKSRQLMIASRLTRSKNIDSMIRIFSNLHAIPACQDIKLLIAGRGMEEASLKELAKEVHCGDSVAFLGFLPQVELSRYISESLAFLINTNNDLNMVSVPESICCATPLVMNEVPLTSWYVKEYGLGIVKTNWDETDIIQVIENNTMYVNNCMAYRDKLSIDATASRLVSLSGINQKM